MAEVVGLVIGGISLAALIDQCISIIKHVDSGASCSEAYQDEALMLTLIGGRLNRWERSLRETTDIITTEEEGKNAERWLKQIHTRLEEAEKLGSRYIIDQPASPTAARRPGERSVDIALVLEKVRDKIFPPENRLSLVKKMRWALIDEEKMTTLVSKLDHFVSNLEKLYPSLGSRRADIVREGVAELLDSGITAESSHTLEALKVAARTADKDFDDAAAASSHTYRDIAVDDKSVITGDYYSDEWFKAGGQINRGGNAYSGISVRGQSTAVLGTLYGGKSPLDIGKQ